MKLNWLVFIWLFIMPIFSIGQDHYLLNDFIAFKEGNRVILNWTIKRGSSCIGIGILRSTNNVDFELIGEIKGVCGSTEKAQSYAYVDEKPVKNANNYYVLEMGFSGKTDPPLRLQFIDVSSSNYKMIPHPFTAETSLFFSNDDFLPHKLNIYDLSGNLIGRYISNTNVFKINLTNQDHTPSSIFGYEFNGNFYVFEILNEDGKLVTKGKFLRI